MSGGVDSSTAAALLMRDGWHVVGVTLANLSSFDTHPAALACEQLGIKHVVIERAAQFEKCVIAPFQTAYEKGLTPNPCVSCNMSFKFPQLMQAARSLGCSHIATGHYARVEFDDVTGRSRLFRARDTKKDQTYFLPMLSQEILSSLVLPLGGYTKDEVRGLAEEAGIASAHASESQDICFIPKGSYVDYLEARGITKAFGPIVDVNGRICGQHKGLYAYTIGQRKGIGVAGPQPYYVIAKDFTRNALVIGTAAQLPCTGCLVEGVNWVSTTAPSSPLRAQIKTRYRQEAVAATILCETDLPGDCVRVVFDEPLDAPACGQTCVFYADDMLLGGGMIVSRCD